MQQTRAKGQRAVAWTLALLLLWLVPAPATRVEAAQPSESGPVIWFFWWDGCPYCAHEQVFLAELKERYPSLTVYSLEVWYHQANRILMQQMAAARGQSVQSVPVTIIDDT